MGIESDVMVFASHWYGYPNDIDLRLKDRSFCSQISTLSSFFLRALRHYDLFHFNFGTSLFSHFPGPLNLLNQADLPILKRHKKGIVVTYQGCDARQKSYCIQHFPVCACTEPDCYGGLCDPRSDTKRAQKIARFNRYADRIFAVNPDLLWVLPARAQFLPYTTVDLDEWRPVQKSISDGRRFLILHSPTQRAVKGTRFIQQAVATLQVKYPEVELKMVEGIPHDQVRELYAEADLVIDQLLLGWYGGFAVEAMALGKPVICYIRQNDLGFLPAQMKTDLPIINADPGNLAEVLEGVLQTRSLLPQVGEKSRLYVETWHDPDKIALQMQRTYEGILQC